MFPSHGRIGCALCFSKPGETRTLGTWRICNDPGHWGSANPIILVLGFSKGRTQSGVYDRGRFEEVAFAGVRPRLARILQVLGLMHPDEDINHKFEANERDFAFGSLLRCSLAAFDARTNKYATSGSLVIRAFDDPEIRQLLTNCATRFLTELPERLRLVLMLGLGNPYIERCRALMGSIYGGRLEPINEVAYRNERATWVHVIHPSRASGRHFGDWCSAPSGESRLAKKRELARQAIAAIPATLT